MLNTRISTLFGAAALLFCFDLFQQLFTILANPLALNASPLETLGATITLLFASLAWVGLTASIFALLAAIYRWGIQRGLSGRWVLPLLCIPTIAPFAIALSAGQGLAELMPRWASAGLLGAILVGMLCAALWITRFILRRINGLQNQTKQARLHFLTFGTASLAFLLLNKYLFWGLYPAFHLLLAAGAAFLALVASAKPLASTPPEASHSTGSQSYTIYRTQPATKYVAGAIFISGAIAFALMRQYAPVAHTRAVIHGAASRQIARINTRIEKAYLATRTPPPRAYLAHANESTSHIKIAGEPPHVLIVSIDGLRASDMSFMGFKHDTTPFLAKIAEDSLVFNRAYSPAANTADTLAALLSNYTIEPFMVSDAAERARHCADQEDPTRLPEQFSRENYRSVCATVYALKQLACVTKGCDVTIDLMEREPIFELMLEQISASAKPIFGMMHLLETHEPYTGFDKDIIAQTPGWTRYERSVLGMDRAVEQFYRKAEQISDRDILWVFVSDHGESFGEHGYQGHDSSLFEHQVRVPLLLHYSNIEPGRIDTPVSTAWLFGTLSSVINSPTNAPRLPLSPDEEVLAPIYLQNKDWKAIISGRWKYMENSATGARWLFDVISDPNESKNLLGAEPERANRMKEELDRRQGL